MLRDATDTCAAHSPPYGFSVLLSRLARCWVFRPEYPHLNPHRRRLTSVSTSTPTLAMPRYRLCAKHFLLAVTGSAPHPKQNKTPGSASANSCSHRNLVFSFFITARKAAS